jgi:hypothetical protein
VIEHANRANATKTFLAISTAMISFMRAAIDIADYLGGREFGPPGSVDKFKKAIDL